MEFIDNTGRPPTNEDLRDATQAVQRALIDPLALTKISPELAVNLPNILRCLTELEHLRQHIAEMPNVSRFPVPEKK